MRLGATFATGWGHLKRCLALAHALREQGARVHFVGESDAPAAVRLVQSLGFTWYELPRGMGSDADDAAATMDAAPLDIVVVDHGRLDRTWHRAVRQAGGATVIAIDQLADRPLAPDLLIDPSPADDHALKFVHVLPQGVPICGGPSFALLEAAYPLHPGAPWRQTVERIGIFMGGADALGHSGWVLLALRRQAGWAGEIHIATTSANRRHRQLAEQVAADPHARLLTDLPDLADFHASCDIAIGTGGDALWERCCLGVPSVSLICADNQREVVSWLNGHGAVLGLEAAERTGAQALALGDAARRLIDAPELRHGLRLRARALCDGRGAERVAHRVLAHVPSPHASVPP